MPAPLAVLRGRIRHESGLIPFLGGVIAAENPLYLWVRRCHCYVL